MIIKPSPFFLAIALLGGMILAALTVSHYQRETTSIEEKYQYRSADEIDATYGDPLAKISNSTYYNDNVTPHSTGIIGLFLQDDQDHDWLNNNAEKIQYGTDPQNPDTDGDGTSDGIEIVLGTDPLDKNSGGVQKIILPTPTPQPPTPPILDKYLRIDEFYKNVRNATKGETKWSHLTQANFGDQLDFLIYMELTNTSLDQYYSATLTDHLGKSLSYISNSGYIRINEGAYEPLSDDWITKAYPLSISPTLNPQKPVPIEIKFNALVQSDPTNTYNLTQNYAALKTDNDLKEDFVFIQLISNK